MQKYRHGLSETEHQIGAVTGLAWTEVGGELLTIESVTVPGKGSAKLTGTLGDVMKESIETAFSYVKARSPSYGIKPSLFNRKDIHIHLPEGATPKDGPSAGVGIVTSIVSTLTGTPVRREVAMTGEVTLRGRVLPIGGLKEKLLAALRGGIETVLIPQENEKDLADIPANIKAGLTIVPVSHVDEVLRLAFDAAGRGDRLDGRGRARRLSPCADRAGRDRAAPLTIARNGPPRPVFGRGGVRLTAATPRGLLAAWRSPGATPHRHAGTGRLGAGGECAYEQAGVDRGGRRARGASARASRSARWKRCSTPSPRS